MRRLQQKVLDHIAESMDAAGLEAVVQEEWANTGQVLVMDGLKVLGTIRYGFYDSYCTLNDMTAWYDKAGSHGPLDEVIGLAVLSASRGRAL